jgi:ATP-dependent RNA helicase RhlE
MPDDIVKLTHDMLRQPERIEVAPQGKTADRIEQKLYFVPMPQKRQLLSELLKDVAMNRVIVFTRTKHGANRVSDHLVRTGISSDAIHGNKSQNARQRALERFRSGEARVLVATDIAARGIDIDDITHVVNFELPNEPESYVHRIGRTARAGAEGIAISFCDASERGYLRDIERLVRNKIAVLEHDLPPRAPGEAVEEERPQRHHRPHNGPTPGKKKNGSRPHWHAKRDAKRSAA